MNFREKHDAKLNCPKRKTGGKGKQISEASIMENILFHGTSPKHWQNATENCFLLKMENHKIVPSPSKLNKIKMSEGEAYNSRTCTAREVLGFAPARSFFAGSDCWLVGGASSGGRFRVSSATYKMKIQNWVPKINEKEQLYSNVLAFVKGDCFFNYLVFLEKVRGSHLHRRT